MLKEFGQIGRWLAEEDLEVRQLSEERLVAFLAARRRAGYRRLPGLRGLKPPLAYLREVGAVDPATVPITALDELLGEYQDWLVVDRGVSGNVWCRPPGGAWEEIESKNLGYKITDRKRPIVLKLHGSLDREDRDQDSFLITEENYVDFLGRPEGGQPPPGRNRAAPLRNDETGCVRG